MKSKLELRDFNDNRIIKFPFGKQFQKGVRPLSLKGESIYLLLELHSKIKILKKPTNKEVFGFETIKTIDQLALDIFQYLAHLVYLRIDLTKPSQRFAESKFTISRKSSSKKNFDLEKKKKNQEQEKNKKKRENGIDKDKVNNRTEEKEKSLTNGNENKNKATKTNKEKQSNNPRSSIIQKRKTNSELFLNLKKIFKKIKLLEIHGGSVTQIADLKKILPTLHTLIITNNVISSLQNVFGKNDFVDGSDQSDVAIRVFSCTGNQLEEIDNSLAPLLELRKLDLSHNKISKIKNLRNNFNLISLDLKWNQISSLSKINSQLGNLTELILSNNQIKAVGDLYKLKSLKILDLSRNLITQFQEIEKLKRLPILKKLFLKGNPICKAKNYFEITISIFKDHFFFSLDNIEISKYIQKQRDQIEYNFEKMDKQNEEFLYDQIKRQKSLRGKKRIASIKEISKKTNNKNNDKKENNKNDNDNNKDNNNDGNSINPNQISNNLKMEKLKKDQLGEISEKVNILLSKVDELKKNYGVEWLSIFNEINLSLYLTESEKKEEQLKKEKKQRRDLRKLEKKRERRRIRKLEKLEQKRKEEEEKRIQEQKRKEAIIRQKKEEEGRKRQEEEKKRKEEEERIKKEKEEEERIKAEKEKVEKEKKKKEKKLQKEISEVDSYWGGGPPILMSTSNSDSSPSSHSISSTDSSGSESHSEKENTKKINNFKVKSYFSDISQLNNDENETENGGENENKDEKENNEDIKKISIIKIINEVIIDEINSNNILFTNILEFEKILTEELTIKIKFLDQNSKNETKEINYQFYSIKNFELFFKRLEKNQKKLEKAKKKEINTNLNDPKGTTEHENTKDTNNNENVNVNGEGKKENNDENKEENEKTNEGIENKNKNDNNNNENGEENKNKANVNENENRNENENNNNKETENKKKNNIEKEKQNVDVYENNNGGKNEIKEETNLNQELKIESQTMILDKEILKEEDIQDRDMNNKIGRKKENEDEDEDEDENENENEKEPEKENENEKENEKEKEKEKEKETEDKNEEEWVMIDDDEDKKEKENENLTENKKGNFVNIEIKWKTLNTNLSIYTNYFPNEERNKIKKQKKRETFFKYVFSQKNIEEKMKLSEKLQTFLIITHLSSDGEKILKTLYVSYLKSSGKYQEEKNSIIIITNKNLYLIDENEKISENDPTNRYKLLFRLANEDIAQFEFGYDRQYFIFHTQKKSFVFLTRNRDLSGKFAEEIAGLFPKMQIVEFNQQNPKGYNESIIPQIKKFLKNQKSNSNRNKRNFVQTSSHYLLCYTLGFELKENTNLKKNRSIMITEQFLIIATEALVKSANLGSSMENQSRFRDVLIYPIESINKIRLYEKNWQKIKLNILMKKKKITSNVIKISLLITSPDEFVKFLTLLETSYIDQSDRLSLPLYIKN
ncbi:serine/threonine-protein kinase 11-interacting protein [Anaeramoeba flamelloides]|uniref:Serine/threonine-protein kinase 11-interacting protein n=1 Tax=Anaeramoeba flamelloides TaxID=1746091 RepID=A0ABQ8XHQ4_9EUKA|nr:serine/threonine-protein kinase 11-interacting protein [Anaeramoeba flamelloides]